MKSDRFLTILLCYVTLVRSTVSKLMLSVVFLIFYVPCFYRIAFFFRVLFLMRLRSFPLAFTQSNRWYFYLTFLTVKFISFILILQTFSLALSQCLISHQHFFFQFFCRVPSQKYNILLLEKKTKKIMRSFGVNFLIFHFRIFSSVLSPGR